MSESSRGRLTRTSCAGSRSFARGSTSHATRRSRRISFARIGILDSAVLDASALIRAAVAPYDPAALEWIRAVAEGRIRGLAPDHAYAEATNALAGYVRHGEIDAADADQVLDSLLALSLEVRSTRLLARQALALSLTRGVSAYDACYLVLAIGYDAVLVTADRRLAEHAERSALLPEQGPPG